MLKQHLWLQATKRRATLSAAASAACSTVSNSSSKVIQFAVETSHRPRTEMA
jgi:hypothetical protein